MKKIIISALLLFTGFMATAQSSDLVTKEFWESKPDLALVKQEMDKGFDFTQVYGMKDPLALAINNEASGEVINYLLEQPGVNLKQLVFEGRIYLHLAAYEGHAEAVDLLLTKGSEMHFLDANGHTALTFAGYQGKLTPEVVDVFLKHDLDIQKKYEAKNGANILLISIPYDSDLVLTDYLVSKGLSLKSTDDNGDTALNHAAQIGDVEMMKELHRRGVPYTENALIRAAQGTYRTANTVEVFQYLVDELKINPNLRDANGSNVLHIVARKRDQEEVVKYFLNKGLDVNLVDDEGNTPFMNAAAGKSFEVVELMFPKVDRKKINMVNTEGESALMNAVEDGSPQTVSLLLKNGADVNIKDKEGNSLAYYLIDSYQAAGGRFSRNAGDPMKDFEAKLQALEKAGLDFKKPLQDNTSIYHYAVAKNDLKLLKGIEHLKADVNQKDSEGNTPLHKAALVAEDDAILRYLLSIGAQKDVKTEFDETAYSLAQENEVLTRKNVKVDFLK